MPGAPNTFPTRRSSDLGSLANLTQAIGPGCAAGITFCFNPSKNVATVVVTAANGEIAINYNTTATGIPQLAEVDRTHLWTTVTFGALTPSSAGTINWHC